MLVLSRRRDQDLYAGPVRIVVVDVRGENVRLGIEAPRSVPVHRREVLDAIASGEPEQLAELGYELNSLGLVVPRRDFLDLYDQGGRPSAKG